MSQRSARAAAVSALFAITVASGCGEDDPSSPRPAADGPNVIVVMTDDQSVDTMRAMPATRRLIGGEGVTFTNAIASFPLCCPSRATFLTGQYAHNHGVLDNQPPTGGYRKLRGAHTLPVWLRRAGYRTAHVGKYLNGYGDEERGPEEVPPGWGRWWGVPGGAVPAYEYRLNENGTLVTYGSQPEDYKTDVLAEIAVEYLHRAVGGERPFFLSVAVSAPHVDGDLPTGPGNPEPAPRDRGSFAGVELPADPALTEADVTDKPEFVRRERLLKRGGAAMEKLGAEYVSQLESLASVDDLVDGLIRALRDQGELANTVFVFTSDNGFVRGQHRLLSGKAVVYEEAIRVPLMIRGPGFPAGERSGQLVANVDLAPTILALAGAEPDVEVDGRSIVDLLERPDSERAILLEMFSLRDNPPFTGVRTDRYSYAEYSNGERELYDLRRDPDQLSSVHDDPAYADVTRDLAARLATLRDCAGGDCR